MKVIFRSILGSVKRIIGVLDIQSFLVRSAKSVFASNEEI